MKGAEVISVFDVVPDSEHVCDNCSTVTLGRDLMPIHDLDQRLDPGGTVPSGECPDCCALVYPKVGRRVYVLVIDNAYGTNVSVHSSRIGARDALYAYVMKNWPTDRDIPIPEDKDIAIDNYFVVECDGSEWTLTEPCEVDS
jgi:hypothetical protein